MAKFIQASGDYPAFFPCTLTLIQVPETEEDLTDMESERQGSLVFIYGGINNEESMVTLATMTIDKALPEWSDKGFKDFPPFGGNQKDAVIPDGERDYFAMMHIYDVATKLFGTNFIWCPWC